MVAVDLSADIEHAERRLTTIQKTVMPRSITTALNKTASNVRAKVNSHISKETGLLVRKVKQRTIQTKATFRRPVIMIIGRRSHTNLIEFVTKAKRKPGAFRKQSGVKANPWRNPQYYRDTFIVKGRYSKKMIVVKRKPSTRRASKSVYGPSVHVEFYRPPALRLFKRTARQRFGINFEHELKRNLSRLKK